MLTEPVKQFLEALRSGRFTQIHGALKSNQGCCCLGVAAELFLPENGKIEPYDDYYAFKTPDSTDSAYLPPYAQKILGIRSWSGRPLLVVEPRDDFPSILEMNDKLRWPFTRIADFLEANAHLYFEGCTRENCPDQNGES